LVLAQSGFCTRRFSIHKATALRLSFVNKPGADAVQSHDVGNMSLIQHIIGRNNCAWSRHRIGGLNDKQLCWYCSDTCAKGLKNIYNRQLLACHNSQMPLLRQISIAMRSMRVGLAWAFTRYSCKTITKAATVVVTLISKTRTVSKTRARHRCKQS